MTNPIKTYSIEAITDLVVSYGQPAFRAKQLLDWLYVKNVSSYDEMTNLPKTLREQLDNNHPIAQPTIVDKQVSADGTRKYVLELFDGTIVESVGIPASDNRLTVCVSSQAGCAMWCAFCATAKNGLIRSLYPGEFADQVLTVENDFGQRVSNLVIMGQGEPFANYDNTLAGLRICNKILKIGARKITVSTCGLIKGIDRFADEPEQFTLAISLHAARQDVRDEIMPGLKSIPLTILKPAIQAYLKESDRRVTFEYALMRGVNDTPLDKQALIDFCSGLLCHVNLICLNEIKDSPYKPLSQQAMQQWCEDLESAGINATIRRSKGADIAGACGQLANRFHK